MILYNLDILPVLDQQLITKESSLVSSHAHIGSNGFVLIELPPGGSVTSLIHTILIRVVVMRILPSENRRPVGT